MTETFYFFAWLAVIFVQMIITFRAIGACFTPKIKEPFFSILGSIACVVPLALIISFLGEVAALKSLIMIGIPIGYSVFACQGSNVKKTFFYVICLAIDSFIEVCLYLLTEKTGLFPSGIILNFSMHRVVLTVFSLMLMVPSKFSLSRIWNKHVNKNYSHVGSVYLVFPMCQVLLYFILIYEFVYGGIGEELTLTLMLAAFTVLAVANSVYLHYIADIESKKALEVQLNDLEYAHKLESEHYKRIEEKRYELAKLRHDLRNELSAVKKLVSTGNTDTAQSLLNDIEKQLDSTTECKYCSSPIIDALISEKEPLLEENNIEFIHNITVAGADSISPVHLCSVFGNLIDNAIKANLEIPDSSRRYIDLTSTVKGGIITVRTSNPINGTEKVPLPENSTGYGLKILKDISAKYSGRFDISIENKICTASIMLNMSKY